MTMRMSIPIKGRAPANTLVARAVAWWRLFAIELHRSPAIFAALIITLITAWLMWRSLPAGVVRWREVSSSASQALLPASALAAGIAAFIAGRDDRLRLGDQLTHTPMGASRRDVLAIIASTAWCVTGYLVAVAGFFLYAAMKATWAGPTWSFVALTVATIALGTAVGWLVGIVSRNRLSPIVAIAAMLGVNAIYPLSADLRTTAYVMDNGVTNFSIRESRFRFLLPYELLDFYDLTTFVMTGIAWIIGLAVLLASVAWRFRHRSVTALITLSMSALISGVAAAELLGHDANTGPAYLREGMAYVTPVCEQRLDGRISVCLHPQDEALLDGTADAIERLVAPIAGIPGVPAIYENQPAEEVYRDPNRARIHVQDQTGIPSHIYSTLLRELLHDSSSPFGLETGSAQWVIGTWLMEETGLSQADMPGVYLLGPVPMTARVDAARADGVRDDMAFQQYSEVQVGAEHIDSLHAAVDRFAELSPAEQRAWLETNWGDLSHGRLTLEDLP